MVSGQDIMAMENWIDTTMGQIHSAAAEALQTVGAQVSDSLKDRLGEAYPPASLPYTDPHKRTGALQGGVNTRLTDNEESITVTVTSTRPTGNPLVPIFLEGGTQNADGSWRMEPREYMLRTFLEWSDKFSGVFEGLFWGAMK